MPKRTDLNKYLYPAIPVTNTPLIEYLAERHRETGVEEAKILIELATDQVKQIRSREIKPLSVQGK